LPNRFILEYYKDDLIRISYVPECSKANIEWYGFPSSRPYRSALKKVADLVKEKKVSKMLIDTTAMKMIGQEDQNWTVKYFLPKVFKNGCKASAIVTSTDYFNRLSVSNILKNIKDPVFKLKVTIDQEEAQQWLKEIDFKENN
jgi:hypothetical protein